MQMKYCLKWNESSRTLVLYFVILKISGQHCWKELHYNEQHFLDCVVVSKDVEGLGEQRK